ncbi:MAG: MotA/TolQ/ExbB proton channel family protein [Gammaproteobacteria bacterium]|jgi:biopolymer transport protein ExbB/TolQ|nr:MotA/TolQ/ExbB proton channel family protein [Gammaproteobacteria bacterium]
MGFIELSMSQISGLFLLPVFLVLALIFAYALFELGRFLFEIIQRQLSADHHKPLTWYYQKHPEADLEHLELQVLKHLEPLRVVSRISPMLGLIATMIPMGPALMGVASGDFMSVAENLSAAFSAVIIALLSASMVFWVLSVRRRWLLEELKQLAVMIDHEA